MVRETCPTFAVADLLGKKWTLPLLQQVELHGHKGFNEMLRRMRKVSPKIMAERLKALEQQSVVKKERAAKDLTRTSYALTQKGKELQEILAQLRSWSEKHCTAVAGCTEKECVMCERY